MNVCFTTFNQSCVCVFGLFSALKPGAGRRVMKQACSREIDKTLNAELHSSKMDFSMPSHRITVP